MYLPALFHETRPPVLHDLIRAHPFAVLVTLDATGLVANHLPMEIDATAGPLGTLRGHVARANPVWKAHRPDAEAMAVVEVAGGPVVADAKRIHPAGLFVASLPGRHDRFRYRREGDGWRIERLAP